mgnify:CR=1 FL=1
MKRIVLILVAILLFLTIVGTAVYLLTKSPAQPTSAEKIAEPNQFAVKQQTKLPVQDDVLDANYETNGKWFGLCPRGAIHSVEDFRKMVDSDPILKAHFANFNWDKAQMGKLEKSMRAYVHYRKDDIIFLKKTPIVLPAGDGFITDGDTLVRTNCCNSYNPVSDLDIDPAAGPMQPQMPLSMESVPLPPVPGQPATVDNPMTPVTKATGASPIALPMPPPVYPPPGYDPPETRPTDDPPPPPVPIPAAVWILGTGLAVLIGLRKKIKN